MDYHKKFFGHTHRAMMWRLERDLLRRISARVGGRRMLDFACGTGRVIEEIGAQYEYALGVDVSESMLEVAKAHVSTASFRCIDLTDPAGRGDLGKFDLITAFRFFPNAEEELRVSAIGALSGMLAEEGRLIFNNHKQQSSVVYRAASILRGRKEGMAHEECLQLIRRAGLEVEEQYHLGVIPFVDRFGVPFPVSFASRLERLASRRPIFSRISSNIIYVCRRSREGR